jgi:hypothetical protein
MRTPGNPAICVADASDCPVGNTPATLFQGRRLGSSSGIEPSWTFSVGGPAVTVAEPEAFKAGRLDQNLVSELCQLGCLHTLCNSACVLLAVSVQQAAPTTASRLAAYNPTARPHEASAHLLLLLPQMLLQPHCWPLLMLRIFLLLSLICRLAPPTCAPRRTLPAVATRTRAHQ